MLNINKKGYFLKCQLGIEMTENACPGAEVRASVHRAGHKKRPAYRLFLGSSVSGYVLFQVVLGLKAALKCH